jgi:crotonobetainyl-CoA:carnitine CoA-transferase CaiB-like acyl-CoA transferase
MNQPGLGRVRQPRPAARFSETPAKIQGHAPYPGEHSREILSQFGYSDNFIDDLYSLDVVR